MRHLAALPLLRASHPAPTVVVTAVAAALASSTGAGPGALVVVTAAVLAGQLSVGWLNDLVDAERDAAVGRRDKPVAGGCVSRRAVLISVLVSAVAAIGLSLPFGAAAAAAHLLALGSAWAYDLGMKAGPLSVFPYALSFGLLPVFLSLAAGTVPPPWLVVAAILLGSAAHFANTLPDLADDRATGVRGLPHRLGASTSAGIAAALVFATSLALGWSAPLPVAVGPLLVLTSGLLLTAGLLLGRRPGSRAAFGAVLVVALVDVGVVVATGA
ncbi:UbiA family prenyltransferase [Saccharopolyspora cebuensis]|uniref:UbiA family prenyltransferase n=1 Tax=Saccharopolyspora cebuensis TaxID=418759 RepID=A0ABV4CS79_9PSEU